MKTALIILILLAGCTIDSVVKENLTVRYETDADGPTATILRRGPDFIPDLNGDGIVNLIDWAFFTKYFLITGKAYQDNVFNLTGRLIKAENELKEALNRLRIVDPNWFLEK